MPPQLPWRLIKSLQNKKIRRKTGKTVAEGPSPVLTAIKEGIKIDFLVMSEEFRDSPDGRAILEAWAENPSPAHTYVVTSHMFNRISHTLSPQGVLCVITLPFEYLDQRETGPWEEDLYIMGVDMQDPGNVGNLIRVGAACGAKILFSSASADPFSPKCIRSSAGSVFRANVGIINSPAEHLRRQGRRSYVV